MFVADEMKLTLSPLEQVEAAVAGPQLQLFEDEPAAAAAMEQPAPAAEPD